MTGLLWLLAALVLGWVAVGRTRAEPRRLGNAFWLLAALLLALNGLVALGLPGGGLLVLAGGGLLLFSPLLVLGLVLLLLANGVVMVRKEGRSLGNLLSLLGGLALLALALTPLLVLGSGLHPVVLAAVLFVDLAAAYLGFVLLAYLGYGWLYPRLVRGRPASWVVVLGSGLADGHRVTPLLAGRLRTGIAEARARRAPVLVLSGGRGADEERSEAGAMAEWARTEGGLAEGSDGPRLVLEEASTSTAENLRLTAALLPDVPELRDVPGLQAGAGLQGGDGLQDGFGPRPGQALPAEPADTSTSGVADPDDGSGRPPADPDEQLIRPAETAPDGADADVRPRGAEEEGDVAAGPGLPPGLVVTSSYHVLRAALLARRLGLPAQAVGAPTARYFWPSAVLREYVAVLAEHRWVHAVITLLVASPAPLLVLWLS